MFVHSDLLADCHFECCRDLFAFAVVFVKAHPLSSLASPQAFARMVFSWPDLFESTARLIENRLRTSFDEVKLAALYCPHSSHLSARHPLPKDPHSTPAPSPSLTATLLISWSNACTTAAVPSLAFSPACFLFATLCFRCGFQAFTRKRQLL